MRWEWGGKGDTTGVTLREMPNGSKYGYGSV